MSKLVQKEFGLRVRTLREKQGISLEKFGLMVGLNKSFLLQIEQGKRNPSLDTIEKLASGFDITISELLKGID